MTLEDMLADQAHWGTIAAIVASEQLPAKRLAEIENEHPEFWQWHMK